MLQDEVHNDKSDLSKRIDQLVKCHGDRWARIIRLQEATPQFHENVCKAILSCIGMLDAGTTNVKCVENWSA
jgi:hypothetical protein